MRHDAWLNAAPRDQKGRRLTRLEKLRTDLKNDAFEPERPPVDAPHIIGYLWEVGPVMAGPNGATPVTHEELRAWQQNIGVTLQPWEIRFLRALSHEYLAESSRASEPDARPPYVPTGSVQNRAAVAGSMKQSIIGMTKL